MICLLEIHVWGKPHVCCIDKSSNAKMLSEKAVMSFSSSQSDRIIFSGTTPPSCGGDVICNTDQLLDTVILLLRLI